MFSNSQKSAVACAVPDVL